MNFRSMKLVAAGLTLLCAISVDRLQGAEPGLDAKYNRVSMGIGSADQVLSGMEYAVVTLAGKKASYEDNIKPNLEIFLIGVASDQPVRFDMLFDVEQGNLMQSIVPISNLKEFLSDNLDPIGIESKADRTDKNFYVLSGSVYEGFLRYLPEPIPYAVFFADKAVLPKGMKHPVTEVLKKEEQAQLAFLALDNPPTNIDTRKAAFGKFIETQLVDFQKLTTETNDQFAFRKEMRIQNLKILQQWVAEAAKVRLGVTIDQNKGQAPATLTFSALPETQLAADLKKVRDQVSLFAAVESPEKAILTGRLYVPVNEQYRSSYKTLYGLARKALPESIDSNDRGTAEEKSARKEVVSNLLDVLTESIDKVPNLDAFIDIVPVKDKHSVLMGVASTNAAKINQIIDLIPKAKNGWKIEKDLEKVGETSIHKLTFGEKKPKALTDFYGASNAVYFAVSETSFWMSGGESALENLKAKLDLVAKPLPEKGSGTLVSFRMNSHPILKNFNDLKNDPELDLLNEINFQTRKQKQVSQMPADAKKKTEESRAGVRASELSNFKWQDTAIAALAGTEDVLEVNMKVDENYVLRGTGNAQKGLLKALGAIISKFADENLK